MNTARLRGAAGTVLPLLLAACATAPSDQAIANLVRTRLTGAGQDQLVAVSHIQVRHGAHIDRTHYAADVSYDLRFRQGLQQIISTAQANGEDPLAVAMGAQVLASQFGHFKAGDTVHQAARLTLVRDPAGAWRLDTGH